MTPEQELRAGAEIGGDKGSPPTANGKASEAPATGLQGLPEGTIQLPPAMVARLTRLMQENPVIHDVLYAFMEGRGAAGPLTLVVPVVLLVPPQTPQQGGQ